MTDNRATPEGEREALREDEDYWTCRECGSALGYPLDSCAGHLLDEEDGGDTRHPPVRNPMTWEQRYRAARRNVEDLATRPTPTPAEGARERIESVLFELVDEGYLVAEHDMHRVVERVYLATRLTPGREATPPAVFNDGHCPACNSIDTRGALREGVWRSYCETCGHRWVWLDRFKHPPAEAARSEHRKVADERYDAFWAVIRDSYGDEPEAAVVADALDEYASDLTDDDEWHSITLARSTAEEGGKLMQAAARLLRTLGARGEAPAGEGVAITPEHLENGPQWTDEDGVTGQAFFSGWTANATRVLSGPAYLVVETFMDLPEPEDEIQQHIQIPIAAVPALSRYIAPLATTPPAPEEGK